MSLTSKGCSPLAALRNPSRLLGKLGRPSRSRREPSSSIHLHTEGWMDRGVAEIGWCGWVVWGGMDGKLMRWKAEGQGGSLGERKHGEKRKGDVHLIKGRRGKRREEKEQKLTSQADL